MASQRIRASRIDGNYIFREAGCLSAAYPNSPPNACETIYLEAKKRERLRKSRGIINLNPSLSLPLLIRPRTKLASRLVVIKDMTENWITKAGEMLIFDREIGNAVTVGGRSMLEMFSESTSTR